MAKYRNTIRELIIQPYGKLTKWDLIISSLVIGVMGYASFLSSWTEEVRFAILIVGAVLLFRVFVIHLFFFEKIKIVFDKEKRVIYKDYGVVFKQKLFNFEDAKIMYSSEDGADYFGLVHKNNRYGKDYILINPDAPDSEKEMFEIEILPKIYELIEKEEN